MVYLSFHFVKLYIIKKINKNICAKCSETFFFSEFCINVHSDMAKKKNLVPLQQPPTYVMHRKVPLHNGNDHIELKMQNTLKHYTIVVALS